MHRWRGLLGVALLLIAGCAPGPQANPAPTATIPPEVLSDLFTAVALVGTQAAQMQGTAVPATATPTPAEGEPSAADDEPSVQTQGAQPVPAPRPVAAAADATPCAPGQLKGNRNSLIYHVPGGGSYARTRANVVCFDSGAEAQTAGYRKARN